MSFLMEEHNTIYEGFLPTNPPIKKSKKEIKVSVFKYQFKENTWSRETCYSVSWGYDRGDYKTLVNSTRQSCFFNN